MNKKNANGSAGKKGELTKASIKAAILDLATKDVHDFHEVTLSRICEQAGVTIGAFYFHFKNKDAAIEELAIESLEEFRQEVLAIRGRDDPEAELGEVILLFARCIVDRRQTTRFVYMALHTSPRIHEAYTRLHFAATDRLQELIGGIGVPAGRSKEETQLLVEFLLAAVESIVENILTWESASHTVFSESPQAIAHKLTSICCAATTAHLADQ